VSVAKRAHAYPQACIAAGELADAAVAAARASVTVRDALALLRRRDAAVLAAGGRYALREDLSRASLLGLDELPATAVARALPEVDARTGEVAVRRLLAAGAPLVIVRERAGAVGAVRNRGRAPVAPVSAAARVARCLPAETRALLATIGRVAAGEGARAFLVGGLVRDVWREAPVVRRDVDVVVEGDGPTVARRLARELGGSLLEHPRFLTASVVTPAAGRIDVATARAERYETRGALPRVLPASIGEDLGRRDFSVNAMAIELGSGDWDLLDPLGGRVDLAQRRLRVLHPLSYVEDPTRMFRAARYATRLGLAPDRATLAAQALALRLVPYPALSGQRIANELALILGEASPGPALAKLGTAGVLRLLDPRYRFTAVTRRRAAELAETLAWARARGLEVAAVELAALALLADQPWPVALAGVARLAFSGEPLARLTRCLGDGTLLARRVAGAVTPSTRAGELRERAPLELAWLRVLGPDSVRAALEWYLGLERGLVALSGDDVMALGVPRGPAVARVLGELRDGRLDGRLTDRAMEIEHVRHWVTKGG
jgi:tRNA nucleotidyltransferase (CCA-adding enzyme)